MVDKNKTTNTVKCPCCKRNLPLNEIRLMVTKLSREDKASLRGSLSAQLRTRIGTEGGRKPSKKVDDDGPPKVKTKATKPKGSE
jgi:hypothetical protein